MTTRVTLIQGGGIGYDQVPAVQAILEAAGVHVEWDVHLAGFEAIKKGQLALPADMLGSVRENRVALKTRLLPDPQRPHKNFNVQLRRELGLFATVRPLKNLRGLPARFNDVDMMVLREITEDLYAAIEHEIVPGVVQSLKVVTQSASLRFFRFAFEWAKSHGRKTIHCVHKANILKLADGLVLEAFRAVAKEFPEITPKEIIVDNCCMQLVSKPSQFDVLAMGNLYGDIVSDLGAGLVGGISATHGINVGENIRVYECFHGGELSEVGAGRANILPLLLPALDLLEGLGHAEPARRTLKAVETVLDEKRVLPFDLGGTAGTREFTEAVIGEIA